jgi:hypothetical protein
MLAERVEEIRGDYRYCIRSTGASSERFGPCEVCGARVSDVHIQTAAKRMASEAGWYMAEDCPTLFGHEACLVAQRKGVSEREARAHVWLWCAYLMRVEATPFEYPDRPEHDPVKRAANFAEAERLNEAGDRFRAKAIEVAGGEIEGMWGRAMDRFVEPER